MFKNTLKSNAPAIAFALAALVSAVPSAALADETRTEHVRYHDLNLANADGVKLLDRRLDRAVKRVCGADDRMNDGFAVARCERKTRQTIVAQREFAIAQAIGQQSGKAWAESTSGRSATVSFAE